MFNKFESLLLSLGLGLAGTARGFMINFLCGLLGQIGWTALV